jgi:spoIIIJ-associated protein
MREIERSAPTVEEAVEAALAELGVSEQEAIVQVVQEPRGGFLGVGSQAAVVRVRVVEPVEHRAAQSGTADPALEEQADLVADFVEDLLERMGLAAEIEISEVHGGTYVDVWAMDAEESIGLLIGRHGATLDGLQDLVRSVVLRQTGERCRVLVDIEDYRKRRRAQVARMAKEVASRVRRSGREEALEPMNAYERKVVHDTIAALGGLATGSEGEEPGRRVVVRPG